MVNTPSAATIITEAPYHPSMQGDASCTVSYAGTISKAGRFNPQSAASFFFDSVKEALQTMKEEGYKLELTTVRSSCTVFFFIREV